jgi:hypothetical protein
MPIITQILTKNFENQRAYVTYYPNTGGTVTIGEVTLPYDYYSDYNYGNYVVYLQSAQKTCEFTISPPSS